MSTENILNDIVEDGRKILNLLDKFKDRREQLDKMVVDMESSEDDLNNRNESTSFRHKEKSKKQSLAEMRVLIELRRLKLEIIKEIDALLEKEVNLRLKSKDLNTELMDKINEAVKSVVSEDINGVKDLKDDIDDSDLKEALDFNPDEFITDDNKDTIRNF